MLGGTVNDVVLTVVSGALASWLRSRGMRTEGLELRALVPVSVRSKDQRGTLGNRLTVMRGPLPVYIRDPMRAAAVRQESDGRSQGVKAGGRRGDARGGQRTRAPDDPGPGLAAEFLDAAVQPDRHEHPRTTGPAVRARAAADQDLFPVAFLPKGHALAVAIMSYNGRIDYGLLGDYDALPDIDLIGAGSRSRWTSCSLRRTSRALAAVRRGRSRTPDTRTAVRSRSCRRQGRGASGGRRPICAPSARAARPRRVNPPSPEGRRTPWPTT